MTVDPTNETPPYTIVIGDDHPVVRGGIRREIRHYSDLQVIGEGQDGAEIIEIVVKQQPDVLILDISLPKLTGIEVLQYLRGLQNCQPGLFKMPQTLVLSAYHEQEYVYALLAAGAKGYLLKDELPAAIIQGIYTVLRGEPALSEAIREMLCSARPLQPDTLSKRERQVLHLVARGYTDLEIAAALRIATSTVRNHLNNIYPKLPSVHTRAEAVAWVWQNRAVLYPTV